jgi:predicted nucleic acid-binding protein
VTGEFVADSSAAIAWVVVSQSRPETDQLAEELKAGTIFVVPVLWAFEVANALLVLRRRRRIEKHEYQQGLHYLSDSRPVVDEEGPRLALTKISKLAAEYELSLYDAVYLELALRRRLPLASRDAALNKAAKASGVRTLL